MLNQTRSLQIAGRKVGRHEAPYCIAEVGINHNGDLALAKRMIEVAKAAGADAVKFQDLQGGGVLRRSRQMFTYSLGKSVTESMLGMFQRYEFSEETWRTIKSHCDAGHYVLFHAAKSQRSRPSVENRRAGDQGRLR